MLHALQRFSLDFTFFPSRSCAPYLFLHLYFCLNLYLYYNLYFYCAEFSLDFTFFPSRSCAPCSRTLSTPDTSAKVTKPKPLQMIIMRMLTMITMIIPIMVMVKTVIMIIMMIITTVIIIITLIGVWWGPSSPSPLQSRQTWQNTPSAPLQEANLSDGQKLLFRIIF